MRKEVLHALRQGRAAMATYLLTPEERHPANAWLYLCADRRYALEKLSSPARRDARRALRELRIERVEWPLLLAKGGAAFRDTRARVGLSDGTTAHFQERFTRYASNPAHHAVAAWREDRMVAFMSLAAVDDWVEIEGSFSTDADRGLCPNNGLTHFVLDQCLVQGGFSRVSYGLSSIQAQSGEAGLHAYKLKVGFEAVPVHRAFALNPLLQPLANRLTLQTLRFLLKMRPGATQLKKASGALSALIEPADFPRNGGQESL
jgi:hypothetical protein